MQTGKYPKLSDDKWYHSRWYYAENQGKLFAFKSESERDHWSTKLCLTTISKSAVRHRYMPNAIRTTWSDWPNESNAGNQAKLTHYYECTLQELDMEFKEISARRRRIKRILKLRRQDEEETILQRLG